MGGDSSLCQCVLHVAVSTQHALRCFLLSPSACWPMFAFWRWLKSFVTLGPRPMDYKDLCKQTNPTSGCPAVNWSGPRHPSIHSDPLRLSEKSVKPRHMPQGCFFCWCATVRAHMDDMLLKVSLINKGESEYLLRIWRGKTKMNEATEPDSCSALETPEAQSANCNSQTDSEIPRRTEWPLSIPHFIIFA